MSTLKEQYLPEGLGQCLDRWYCRSIENAGNIVSIDGGTFSVDSPAITTDSKSKFMLNQYEWPERQAVAHFVDPGLPVVEFGGSIGVVACLTNRRLANPRSHVVVEPNPDLVPVLLRNRDLNRCQFDVVPKLVGYDDGHALFYPCTGNFVEGTAVAAIAGVKDSQVKAISVPTVSLRSILAQYGFERCNLICDIEGGESELLRREADVLESRVATLILEVHESALGVQRVQEILRDLVNMGFQQMFAARDTYAFQRRH